MISFAKATRPPTRSASDLPLLGDALGGRMMDWEPVAEFVVDEFKRVRGIIHLDIYGQARDESIVRHSTKSSRAIGVGSGMEPLHTLCIIYSVASRC
jgi:hypothetical protein